MATGTLPDAGQILNSLINSILLVDDDLAVHFAGNDSNLLIVFYVQIVPDDFVMQLHRF